METTATQHLSLVAATCGEECMQIRHLCDQLSDGCFDGDPDDVAEINTALIAVRNCLIGIRSVCEHEVQRAAA